MLQVVFEGVVRDTKSEIRNGTKDFTEVNDINRCSKQCGKRMQFFENYGSNVEKDSQRFRFLSGSGNSKRKTS